MFDLDEIIIHIILQIDPYRRQILLYLLLIVPCIGLKLHLAASPHGTNNILLFLRFDPGGVSASGLFTLIVLLYFTTFAELILQNITFRFESFSLQIDTAIHYLLFFEVKLLSQVSTRTHGSFLHFTLSLLGSASIVWRYISLFEHLDF